ncbi:hypothetical protein GCM10010495_82200 [Kitasatospora herbaricolor]|uniref:Uncharacterized protein n=1 Tax=Kitasatospora indigofera TaxID=67307 RepID=A0A919DA42_9ACTN|nr:MULTISPECIES: hypothetical protein [Kitasatospora]MDQ0305849.1 hypothetical protein [Kitasatospora herbaricolor]GGV53283.1 hypothetical protein GCM10010495_82200 [Kitasatospora herbaricolor]GHE25337.1 hypothetical protein GCM10018781_76680 [Kitasatospora indigofera]
MFTDAIDENEVYPTLRELVAALESNIRESCENTMSPTSSAPKSTPGSRRRALRRQDHRPQGEWFPNGPRRTWA